MLFMVSIKTFHVIDNDKWHEKPITTAIDIVTFVHATNG